MTALDIYLDQRANSPFGPRPTKNHNEPPKIDSDIPLPPDVERRGGSRNYTYSHFYPFEDMKPGDSFWIAGEMGDCTCGAVTKFAKRSGWRFTSRGQTRDGRANKSVSKSERGIRVWRIN